MKTPSLLLAVLLVGIGGCSTITGGPKPPFDPKKIETTEFIDAEGAFKDLAVAEGATERNQSMNKLLALVDARYAFFVREFVRNDRHGMAAALSLLNGATIAGGLTNSKGVKDNWLALTQLVSGEQLIYGKTYLNDKSISTVVAQMNAARKRKLLEIRRSMETKDTNDYSGQMALVDILDYYSAGTPMGAMLYAEQAANEDAATAESQLRVLDEATDDEITKAEDITTRLYNMVQKMTPVEEAGLRTFLEQQDVSVDAVDGKAGLTRALNALRRDKFRRTGSDLIAKLEQAGIKVP